jgi:hypothetical protein
LSSVLLVPGAGRYLHGVPNRSAVKSALWLANFNIDTGSRTSLLAGLYSANALLIMLFPLM